MAPPSRRSPVTPRDPAREPHWPSHTFSTGRRCRCRADVLDADGPALLVQCAHRAGDPHGPGPRRLGHLGVQDRLRLCHTPAESPPQRRVDLGEWLGAQPGRSAAGPGPRRSHEPGLAEHPQAPRDPGSGDGQRLGQLAGRGRMVAQGSPKWCAGSRRTVRAGPRSMPANVPIPLRTGKGTKAGSAGRGTAPATEARRRTRFRALLHWRGNHHAVDHSDHPGDRRTRDLHHRCDAWPRLAPLTESLTTTRESPHVARRTPPA